jgi:UDP-N-acetylglucosamine 3-dehydrogenase
MIRTAVIGLTTAGTEHARAYAVDPLSELIAVCDSDSDRAATAAVETGAPAVPSVTDVITAGPDLVSVRAPLPERTDIIDALLDAGMHVVASLPFAQDIETLAALAEKARARNLILAADYHLRFSPAMSKAQGWVSDGEVGNPLFVNMNLFSAPGAGPASDEWQLFRNLGSHGIDAVRLFCGETKRVQCFAQQGPNGMHAAQINLHMSEGMVGTLTLCDEMSALHPIARVEMAGSNARFTIENVYEEATLYTHTDEEKHVLTNTIWGGIPQLSTTYGRRLSHLLQQIDAGTNPDDIDAGLNDALAASAVMEAAIEAARNDSVVDVGPFAAKLGVRETAR